MFNLQGSELIIILLLALVVLGPEKLPEAMRKAGKAYGELKKMSNTFQQEFKSVVDEPLREVRDTANLLRDSADFTRLQNGERDEKPKSAEMVAAADPDARPVDEIPTFDDEDDEDASHDEAEAAAEPTSTAGLGDAPDRRPGDVDITEAPPSSDGGPAVEGEPPSYTVPKTSTDAQRLSTSAPVDRDVDTGGGPAGAGGTESTETTDRADEEPTG